MAIAVYWDICVLEIRQGCCNMPLLPAISWLIAPWCSGVCLCLLWFEGSPAGVTCSKKAINGLLGGGFKYFYFQPYLGRWPNLTNIFQRGWNHQLDYSDSARCKCFLPLRGPSRGRKKDLELIPSCFHWTGRKHRQKWIRPSQLLSLKKSGFLLQKSRDLHL